MEIRGLRNNFALAVPAAKINLEVLQLMIPRKEGAKRIEHVLVRDFANIFEAALVTVDDCESQRVHASKKVWPFDLIETALRAVPGVSRAGAEARLKIGV